MRPIDADALKERYENTTDCALVCIDEAPTLDMRPNIHGHWIKGGYTFVGVHRVDEYICSMCDYHTLEAGNYCGDCGAIMEEVAGNDEQINKFKL